MRFCMVTTFYPPYHFGGDATYVRSLARALVSRGHEVEVIHCEDAYRTVSHTQNVLPVIEDDGIKVSRLKSRMFGLLSPLITQQTGQPGLKSRALKKILSRNFDVVHFHNISLIGGPAVLALSHAPVTLYTLHEHWLLCPTHIFWKNRQRVCDKPQCLRCSIRSGIPPQLWRYTGLIKRSLRNVDMLLAPSHYTAEKHRAANLSDNIRLLPLYSTFNPEYQNNTVTDSSKSGQSKPFVFVGRVTASKGIVELVNIFSNLPDIRLQVVGDGDLLESLKLKYATAENIQFTGAIAQDKLVDVYHHAKALILPSLAPETFGLTIVEAFSCGVPALVRNSGGSRDIVDQTGGGFVYQTDEELIAYVKQLDADPELCDKLGARARQGYESFYTEDKHIKSYLNIIKELRKEESI